MPAPTTGLTIIKAFDYRGKPGEEFSNHYWLSGSTPSDSSAWRVLFDALVLQEKTIYAGNVKVVAGYGYSDVSPSAHAVWTVDLTVPPNAVVAGTLSTASGSTCPGDAAVWVRWGLDRLNSKGKRIYLRKYFHGARAAAAGGDAIETSQLAALNAFGTKMRDGSFTGARVITDTQGTATLGTGSSAWVTTRTLKRRGKRPPT